VEEKVRQLAVQNRQLAREVEALKMKLASSAGSDILSGARTIRDVKVLATLVEGADPKTLRDLVDQIKSRIEEGVVLLAAVDGDKVALTAGVTKNLTARIKAGELMKFAAEQLGGKGGGRPDLAQGGGSHPERLATVLESVYLWAENQLSD
jgi:alanyl-tRNA synthetase